MRRDPSSHDGNDLADDIFRRRHNQCAENDLPGAAGTLWSSHFLSLHRSHVKFQELIAKLMHRDVEFFTVRSEVETNLEHEFASPHISRRIRQRSQAV